MIRTKRLPLLGRDVDGYAGAYRAYFAEHATAEPQPQTMLDPAPRVILDPELGVADRWAARAQDAAIAFDVYEHTIDIIQRADAPGRLPGAAGERHLRRRVLGSRAGEAAPAGQPAALRGRDRPGHRRRLGIGKAAVESFLKRGAAVVGLDLNPAIGAVFRARRLSGHALRRDRRGGVERALDAAVATRSAGWTCSC